MVLGRKGGEMNIKITVIINNGIPSDLEINTPDDIIRTYSVEEMVKDFIGDRLILAGYPRK